MEAEQEGTIFPPFTASIEKNSRGWTWNVKVRGSSQQELQEYLSDACQIVRHTIHLMEKADEAAATE